MAPLALAMACTLAADLSPQQLELLKIFRSEFVELVPGEGKFPEQFEVGSDDGSPAEKPAHRVHLRHRFAIAKYEAPQNLWEAVMGSNPSKWKGPRNSVEMLTWEEARTFCSKATELMRTAKIISEDEIIRLPTEAEWEYAARAGTRTIYSFGDQAAELGKYAWSTENAAGNDPPVGAKLPNPWGLYDVHGYLWEWCEDHWHDHYQNAPTDGSAWLSGETESRRVARGGSWKDPAPRLTSSFRQPFPADRRDDALGLRCVLSKARQ